MAGLAGQIVRLGGELWILPPTVAAGKRKLISCPAFGVTPLLVNWLFWTNERHLELIHRSC